LLSSYSVARRRGSKQFLERVATGISGQSAVVILSASIIGDVM